MIDDNPDKHSIRLRRGQTLAEFALTLPILLVLTFGIVEFGRLFQAWVTIQNAAREAARYATTGQFDTGKYTLDLLPCDPTQPVGVRYLHYPDPEDTSYSVEVYGVPDATAPGGYRITPNSLFATWYDGAVCDPGSPEHEEMRRDILRIASIMDVSRRGAGGLSLEPNTREGTFDSLVQLLFETWQDPLPRSDLPRYFNTTICSSRTMIGSSSYSLDTLTTANQRFVTVYEDNMLPAGARRDYTTPLCMLNEVQEASQLDIENRPSRNYGTRWIDPGGPGDRITVFVTFNHALITPLGLADFVQMEARRSGVNESFRAARALNAVQGSPGGVNFQSTPTPLPPSATPTATDTNTPLPTITLTPTWTETPTAGPFTCDNLQIHQLSFDQQKVYIRVRNNNEQDTELHRVKLNWQPSTQYPVMYLSAMALNSEINWRGEQRTPTSIDTNSFTGTDLTRFSDANRRIPGQGDVSWWEGVFLNGGNLGTHMSAQNFGGSEFQFLDSWNNVLCTLIYEPENIIEPTNPPGYDPPDTLTPSPTFTPDCASDSISVTFDRFESFGVVVLRVQNTRYATAPLVNFDIRWPHPIHDLGMNFTGPGSLQLDKISVGGSHADDTDMGVVIWRGPDSIPNTTPNDSSTTFWRGSQDGVAYIFPPRSSTYMYLDFAGTATNLQTAFGIGPHDFNGTSFEITCEESGGPGGGPGNIVTGLIHMFNEPTPAPPTNTPIPPTPGPTNTRTPTYTPRPTNTRGPTSTPRPTRMPSNTPLPVTPTFTQQPPPGGAPTAIGELPG